MIMDRILHITHNDLDGAGCSIIVKNIYDYVDTYYLDYKDVDSFILENMYKYKEVIVTDVTPKKDIIEEVCRSVKLLIIDHHKTNTHLQNKSYTIYNTNKSATNLTYEWGLTLKDNIREYEPLVKLINDYDLWLSEFKESKDLNILFTSLGINKFVRRFLKNANVNFTECEKLIIDLENENLHLAFDEALRDHRIFKDRWDNPFCLTIAEKYNSEIGDYLLNKLDVKYVLMVNSKKNKISLRSKGNFDVSNIATHFGGGGHKNAAGFRIDFIASAVFALKDIGLLL